MKKGKLIIFLFAIIFTMGYNIKVKADSFIPAEEVENVYRNKEKDGVIISSVQHRLIRNAKTNEIAYCLEPFTDLIGYYEYKNSYQEYSAAIELSIKDYERITLLAYYGYGYSGHNDIKWHSITQILIWRTIDKNADFYWVDRPNGKRIEPYKQEIEELEKLVSEHNKMPYFTISKIYSINKEYSLIDNNNVLSKFNIKSSSVTSSITDDTLKIESNSIGNKKIELEISNNKYTRPVLIFTDNLSQNIIQRGNVPNQKFELDLLFAAGSLSITKIDSDTLDIYPRGKALLTGAIYNLYDADEKLIAEMKIDGNSKASIDNLTFGNYKLVEVQSGAGYYLNEKIYEFVIEENNHNIEMEVDNEVIQSKIIIRKYFGNEADWQGEADITFEIYSSNGELYTSLTTNRKGIIEVTLPYDEYTIVQLNSTPNYQKVSDFKVIVNESSDKEIIINLYDLEIETPDTYINPSKNNIHLLCLVVNISICSKVSYE